MSFRFLSGRRLDRGRGLTNGVSPFSRPDYPSFATCPCCRRALVITHTDRPGWLRAECRNYACPIARIILSGAIGEGEAMAVRALREAWFYVQQANP